MCVGGVVEMNCEEAYVTMSHILDSLSTLPIGCFFIVVVLLPPLARLAIAMRNYIVANTTQDVSSPSPVDDLELPVLRRRDTNELVPSSVAWTASTHGEQTASRKLGPFERTLLVGSLREGLFDGGRWRSTN